MLKKLFFLVTMAVLSTVILSACGNKNLEGTSSFSSTQNSSQASNTAQSKIPVVVSFNALSEFASAIGKDKIEIKKVVPDGTEPHDFEPKASDIVNIGNAKIFIYNGLGMESSWLDKTLKAANNPSLEVIDASFGIEPIKISDNEKSHEHDEDKKEHDHGEYDPHIWLSLKNAKIESENIKNGLVKQDPENKDFYENNFKEFSGKLDALYNEYSEKFNRISKNKNFVTGHAAFGYLCRDFGLVQNSIEDVFAEGEPSAKKLKELVDYARENNIKTIFVEELVSPKISETLANDVGAKTEKIYTIESKEENKDYLQSMEENLKKIYASLN